MFKPLCPFHYSTIFSVRHAFKGNRNVKMVSKRKCLITVSLSQNIIPKHEREKRREREENIFFYHKITFQHTLKTNMQNLSQFFKYGDITDF